MEYSHHQIQTEQHQSNPDVDNNSKPLDSWIGDELLAVLNSYLDKTNRNISQRPSPPEPMDDKTSESSDSGYHSVMEPAYWPGPRQTLLADTASSTGDSDASVDEGRSSLSPPSETRTPWPSPISTSEPLYVAIASSTEKGTLFEDTKRWMDGLEKEAPLPTTRKALFVKTEGSTYDNENLVEYNKRPMPPATKTTEAPNPFPNSTTTCELLPDSTGSYVEENELSSENKKARNFRVSQISRSIMGHSTESYEDKQPLLPPGHLVDPIFGDVRRRTKLDDFPDCPRRLWEMWRQKPEEQRHQRIPRGYRQGHSGLEYEEWLEDTKDRWENTSLGQNASDEDSD